MREHGAVSAEMPTNIAPHLATLATLAPSRDEWSYEIKWDGYRMLARIDNGRVQLFTRNGHDWTKRLPLVAKALAALPVRAAWLDSESIVLGENG